MNYEKCINQIIEFSERFYKSLDFAHNIEHGKRVVKNAKKIAEIEGGNLFLIEAGGWLHQFHDNIDEVNNFIIISIICITLNIFVKNCFFLKP